MKTIVLLLILISCLTGGCATLSESECRNANWYMIGFEDGTKGSAPSRIGDHRQACSKYNIIPDMDTYLNGYGEGIKQFCTESQGFYSGKNGYKYYGVCPPETEEDFLRGYTIGRSFYELDREIDHAETTITSSEKRIRKLDKKISEKEQLLLNETTVQARKHLLDEIKEIQREIGGLEHIILEHEKLKAVKESEYFHLENLYNY